MSWKRNLTILYLCAALGAVSACGDDPPNRDNDNNASNNANNANNQSNNANNQSNNANNANNANNQSNNANNQSNNANNQSNNANNANNNPDPIEACRMACSDIATSCRQDFLDANCPEAAIDQLAPTCQEACNDEDARAQIAAAANLPCATVVPLAIDSFGLSEVCVDGPVEVCDNTTDDDGDGDADCDDDDCAADPACEPLVEICDNTTDDDGDGDADCDDDDCETDPACVVVVEICDNTTDDDGDGDADCDDDECADDPACPPACTDSCDNEGDTQCSAGGDVETCMFGGDGCLAFGVTDDCGARESCDDTGVDAVCACDDTCDNAGDTACSADDAGIQTCTADADGCLFLADPVACDANMICDDTGTPTCVPDCTDTCGAAGDTQCNASGDVETCALGADGCLAYVMTDDCGAREVCDDAGADAVCACDDACATEGDAQCSADGTSVETCSADADGCLFLDAVACGPNQLCDDATSTPSCVCLDEPACDGFTSVCGLDDNGDDAVYDCTTDADGCVVAELGTVCTDQICLQGTPEAQCSSAGSCAEPFVVEGSFGLSGPDISIFGDSHTYNNPSCSAGFDDADAAEVIFTVQLSPGESVLVRELGGLDAVLKIQAGPCDPEGLCEGAEDLGNDESGGILFTASTAGEWTVIVGSYYADLTGLPSDFEIAVDVIPAEDCTNDQDDNLDGLTDCDDPTCFGAAGACEVEESCDDAQDNDADGDRDCEDSDCSALPACAPARGVFEQFTNTTDLQGNSVLFAPALGGGYTFTSRGGLTAFPVVPGSGAVQSTALPLTDDSFVEISLPLPFNFFGQPQSRFFVGSNGFITAGAGDMARDLTLDDFFAFPRIAVLDADLNPSARGSVRLDLFIDRVVVSWVDVPRFQGTVGNNLQIIVHIDGRIELHYVSVDSANLGAVFVGVNDGDPANNGVYPMAVDLIPPRFVINEVVYDDPGNDDAEFVEIHTLPDQSLDGLTLVHHNGTSNGTAIWEIPLMGQRADANGFFVVGDVAVPGVDLNWAGIDGIAGGMTSDLQNDNESLVLYRDWNGTTGTRLDAVAWEFSNATNYFGEGNFEPGLTTGNFNTSIGRFPDGRDTDQNNDDFNLGWFASPGVRNFPHDPQGFSRLTASGSVPADYPAAIPDNNVTGLTRAVNNITAFNGTIVEARIGLFITHTYIGDLTVTLTSPGDRVVTLHDATGGTTDNIITQYDVPTLSADGLDLLNGEVLNGTAAGPWELRVIDESAQDTGSLVDWVIYVRFQ